MSSSLTFGLGIPLAESGFLRGSPYVNNILTTAASAPYALTIPAGMNYVRLCGNADFFVKWGTTGVSTAAASDGTGSELVPLTCGGVNRNIGSSLGTTAITVMSTAAAMLISAAWWDVA